MSKHSEHFFDLSLDLLLIVGPEGITEQVNSICKTLLGWDPSDLIGKHFKDFIEPNSIEASLQAFGQVLGGQELVHFENQFLTKSGKTVDLRWSAKVDRETNYVYASARDTTWEKAEQKKILEQTRNEYRTQALDASAIVGIADTAGNITHVNSKFCEVSGYTEPELIGQNHRILKSGHHPDSFFENMWKKISTGQIWRGEVKNKRKNGTFYWVYSTIVPMKDSLGKIYQHIAIRHEITDLKNAELESLKTARLSSVMEMTNGLCHEMNNPMAILRGKSQLMAKALADPTFDTEKINRDLNTIVATVDRMVFIVKSLAEYSQPTMNKAGEESDTEEVLQTIRNLFTAKCKAANIKLNLMVHSSHKVACCHFHLTQILFSLLNNAFDAVSQMKDPWISLAIDLNDDQVIFTVDDSGPGIPAAISDLIMEPFYTSKPVGSGMGLGLSVASGLATTHGGILSLDKTCPNTRFILTLPRA